MVAEGKRLNLESDLSDANSILNEDGEEEMLSNQLAGSVQRYPPTPRSVGIKG